MEKKELDVTKYEKIHAESGYELITTAEMYIPWFKCIVKCKCEKEYPMSDIDKIFCLCIDRGINTIKDISFILSLDVQIVEGELERLLLGQILICKDECYYLTDLGRNSYERKIRLNAENKEFTIYFNSITGEWSVQHENKVFDRMIDSSLIKLNPIKTVIKDDIENNVIIKKALEELHETNIIKLQLLDYKVVEFYKENILFYQNELKNVLFEIYDEVTDELDIALSAALRNKYEKREILELIRTEDHLKIAGNALLKYVEDKHPKINIKQTQNSLRYVRNQEIRELFLQKLEEAKKELFIISPWITDFVVDDVLIDKFEAVLEKGIQLTIGFGYVSKGKMNWKLKKYQKEMSNADSEQEREKIEGRRLKDKEIQTWEMANYLRERFQKYDNFEIFYVREGTHEKVFCFDEENILVGSYNLLSYDGGEHENYSGFKFRYEGGVLIKDRELALGVMKDFICSAEKI